MKKKSDKKKTVKKRKLSRKALIRKITYLTIGFLLVFLGLSYLLSSFTGMTGFVVSENMQEGTRGVLGTFLLIGGLAVLSRVKEEKRRKGQAALEFLMTYGWTILIAILVIGVLAYIGVFKTQPPSRFVLAPPLTADAIELGTDSVTLEFTNNGPVPIILDELKFGGLEGAECPISTDLGQQVLNPGAKIEVDVPCASTGEGTSFAGEVSVKYHKTGTASLDLASQGDITGGEKMPQLEQGVGGGGGGDIEAPKIYATTLNGGDLKPPLSINEDNPDLVVITDEPADCRVGVGAAEDTLYSLLSNDCVADIKSEKRIHTCTPSLIEGTEQEVHVSCLDESVNFNENDGDDNLDITDIEVDLSPPIQISHLPIPGFQQPNTQDLVITVNTDELAICRWATTDLEFSRMTEGCLVLTITGSYPYFTETYCNIPQALLEGQGSIELYVSCEDDTKYYANGDTIETNTQITYPLV